MNSGQTRVCRLVACGSRPGRSARVGNWSGTLGGASHARPISANEWLKAFVTDEEEVPRTADFGWAVR
jgi:hypothetical protein